MILRLLLTFLTILICVGIPVWAWTLSHTTSLPSATINQQLKESDLLLSNLTGDNWWVEQKFEWPARIDYVSSAPGLATAYTPPIPHQRIYVRNPYASDYTKYQSNIPPLWGIQRTSDGT